MFQAQVSPSPVAVSLDDGLVDIVGPLDGARVLVIGHGALDTVCSLIRHGCTAATELQTGGRVAPEADSADAVIVPHAASLAEAQAALALAARALVMGGRIAVRETAGLLRQPIAAMLRAHGFCAVAAKPTFEGTVVTAERPIFGPLHRG